MLFNAIIATTALFTGLASSAPTATEKATIAKRGEGIHLVNCYGPGKTFSGIAYCANDNACTNPSSNNWVSLGGSNQVVTWENIPYRVTFGSGVGFHFFIEDHAQARPTYSVIDTSAGNDFRGFTGYKDDQHLIFSRDGAACYSIYYYI